MAQSLELVGLVPCAGRATRLGAQDCSKEILPIMLPEDASHGPVCGHLLRQMRTAGIERVWMVLRTGKWDIPAALGDGSHYGLDLSYLTLEASGSVPETLDRARRHVRSVRVAVGFPDVIATPCDALARLAAHQVATGADVALGLFPTDRPDKADMVEVDKHGNLIGIEIKPQQSALRYTWLHAIWGPAMTELLHDFVVRGHSPEAREPFLSDVVLFALANGLAVTTLSFQEGSHLDVGTPEDLKRARTPRRSA